MPIANTHRLILATAAVVLAAAVVAGCDKPNFGTRLTPAQATEIGAEAAVQVESQYPPSEPSEPGVVAVQEIEAALKKQAQDLPPGIALQFNVIETQDEMAFSLPDGHIYISSGLLAKIGTDKNEIACVMAHEAGHVALQHDSENIAAALGADDVADMLAQGKYQDVVSTELQLVRLSYTKEQEYDADEYAVRLVASSGYDATAMARFLSFVASEPHVQGQVLWDQSHPLSKIRIPKVKQDIAALSR